MQVCEDQGSGVCPVLSALYLVTFSDQGSGVCRVLSALYLVIVSDQGTSVCPVLQGGGDRHPEGAVHS